MESNTSGPGGTESVTSGDSENKADASASGDAKQNTATYPAHFVDKLKKEKDSKVRQIAELTQRLESLEQERDQSQVKDLEEKEQFKTLYEQEKTRRSEIEQRLGSLQTAMVEARKKSAVKKELLKLGLDPVREDIAFRLIDTSAVIVDDETNVIIGAEDVAKAFYDQNKDLGIFGRQTPGVSHQAPQRTGGTRKNTREMNSNELKEVIKSTFE